MDPGTRRREKKVPRIAKNITKIRTNLKTRIATMRNTAIKQRKKNIMTRERGIINKRVHTQAYDYVKNHVNNFKFYIAIGHGIHMPQRNDNAVLVPNNVWLIYTTKPGYWGNVKDATDPKFVELITNENKLKRLIKGTLQSSEVPDLMARRQWKWYEHVYPPGSFTADHMLELYDHDAGTNLNRHRHGLHTTYDNLSGMYKVPSPTRHFHGDTKTVGQFMEYASQQSGSNPSVVIISGCRGDPAVSTQLTNYMKEQSQRGQFLLDYPQTYPIPTQGNYIQKIANYEKNLGKIRFNQNAIKKNIRKVRFNGPFPSQRNVTALKRQYKNFFVNKNANAYIMNVLRPRIQNTMQKIVLDIRSLPSTSQGYPSKPNINRLVNKYPAFFRNKNATDYVKGVLNPSRAKTIQKIKNFGKSFAETQRKKRNIVTKFKNVVSKAKQQANNVVLGIRTTTNYPRSVYKSTTPLMKSLQRKQRQRSPLVNLLRKQKNKSRMN